MFCKCEQKIKILEEKISELVQLSNQVRYSTGLFDFTNNFKPVIRNIFLELISLAESLGLERIEIPEKSKDVIYRKKNV